MYIEFCTNEHKLLILHYHLEKSVNHFHLQLKIDVLLFW